ncbi:MAG: glycerol-3-phosphate acyltransferase [Oscillospiraceae bacterium]|nr:glycerol-3-phosphate acyltransferase [Oscillospiraceae bacterium]
MLILKLILVIVVGYLLGNLNGAILASKLRGDDVRSHGSGNAGLTNFIRSYGANHSLLVIVIDGGKGVLSCVLGGLLLNELGFTAGAAVGGTAVMLGHMLPVFYGFRGGKGILTGLFVAVVTDWRVALLILAVFAVFYFSTRYVSLSSVMASAAFAIGFAVLHYQNMITMCCGVFMGAMAVFMHRSNIVRLVKGQETKTDLFKKK